MVRKIEESKAVYKRLLKLAIPIMIQNAVTNLVNMVDNIMVGRIGTVQMAGVAVTNQLIFVFNLCIFGALAGAGIFGAQYAGQNDVEGVRHTFRFKMLFCTAVTAVCILLFYFKGDTLAGFYLDSDLPDSAKSIMYSQQYMKVMLIGLIPYTVAQCYSSTLRENGQSVLPMISSSVAVAVNMIFNGLLIFGLCGFPRLGVIGAAIATVISRFAELLIVVIWTYLKKNENKFIVGAFRSFYIPKPLVKSIFLKGTPLMVNETLWASGVAMLYQCYSVRGLHVVAANNISQTFFNVFSVAFISIGVATGIILGQMLGSNDFEGAKTASLKLMWFSAFVTAGISVIYIILAEFIPLAYNTTDEIRHLATRLMQICALEMPLDAYSNASYYTIRSGGKAFITMVFDSFFIWIVNVSAAFVLTRYTTLGILTIFAICQFLNIFKCIIGYVFVKKGSWIRNIVEI